MNILNGFRNFEVDEGVDYFLIAVRRHETEIYLLYMIKSVCTAFVDFRYQADTLLSILFIFNLRISPNQNSHSILNGETPYLYRICQSKTLSIITPLPQHPNPPPVLLSKSPHPLSHKYKFKIDFRTVI